MPVSLAPSPRQQYIDANGNPIVGGKLFTYLSNTSTKAATYTDGSGTSANTNPIILDDQGRIPHGLFLINGISYSFVLAIATDTDPPTSPIFTENDITGINDTTAIDAEYALLSAAVADMANDAILSAVEKSILRKEWDVIANEKAVLEAQATTYAITTEKSSYTAAWVALAGYLNNSVAWVSGVPLWLSDAELGNNTTVVPSTFRLTFRTYYDTRTTLIKKITDVANANTGTAQTDATTALAALTKIASDDYLSSAEKLAVRQEWDYLESEKAQLESVATAYSITTEKTAVINAWATLNTYLNAGTTWTSGVPSWISNANLGTDTIIVGTTFRSNWVTYFNARDALKSKISNTAVNPGTKITTSNGVTYIGSNAMTSQSFAEAAGPSTAPASPLVVTFDFDSANYPVILYISCVLVSKITDVASPPGVCYLTMKVEAGATTLINEIFAVVDNTGRAGNPNLSTASRLFPVNTPGSGSVTYKLTCTFNSVGGSGATGGSVKNAAMQLIYLKF